MHIITGIIIIVPYSQIYILAEIMFGGLLEKGRKLQLADINLPVTVRSPRLLQGSTQLVQYWRI